jgi:hypothetical protein
MVATATQTEERPRTRVFPIDELESLVATAVRLAQVREQRVLTEEEFATGLSRLFRQARDARAEATAEYHRVYLDWSHERMEIEAGAPSDRYDAVYARIDRLLQPYFAYAWEYDGGSAQDAVRFNRQEMDGIIAIEGAWVDLVR